MIKALCDACLVWLLYQGDCKRSHHSSGGTCKYNPGFCLLCQGGHMSSEWVEYFFKSMMVMPEHTHLTNSWMRVAILLVVMYTKGVSWYGSILKTCYWDDSAILLWGPFSVRIWLNIAWGRHCPTPAWESGHSLGSFGCTKWFVWCQLCQKKSCQQSWVSILHHQKRQNHLQ